MKNDSETRIPSLLPGWQTGNMRKKERGGDNVTHDKNMRVLAERLAIDIAEQVTKGDLSEAVVLVEANLIGVRQGKRRPAVAANPDAQRLLDEEESRWGVRATRDNGASKEGLGRS